MKKKNIIMLVAALAVVIVALGVVYKFFGPKAQSGSKNVTIEVYFEDGGKAEKTYNLKTDEEFLGKLLLDEKIAVGEDGPYGLYIKTVCDKTVDDSKQEWWCITANGFQMVNTAPDLTPILDGDKYEITMKVGY
ncbi:MAG: hypothetical protein RR846_03125 [Oscillospiraceae bacterium]